MAYQPIHLRELRVPAGYVLQEVDFNGERAVFVRFPEPFVFGNIDPYSTGKMFASQVLRKNYDRIRVVDLSFENERVQSLTYAYRKAGS